MEPETPAPWWSWAPRFPKIAIAIAALLYNAVAAGTILWRLNNQENLAFWPSPGELLAAVITDSITSNAVALAMFLQLNAELISMILTLKANYEEKKEAVAKAKAEAAAPGQSGGRSRRGRSRSPGHRAGQGRRRSGGRSRRGRPHPGMVRGPPPRPDQCPAAALH